MMGNCLPVHVLKIYPNTFSISHLLNFIATGSISKVSKPLDITLSAFLGESVYLIPAANEFVEADIAWLNEKLYILMKSVLGPFRYVSATVLI